MQSAAAQALPQSAHRESRELLRNLAVVFGGRVAFVALAFVGSALVVRGAGEADVGVYWLCVTAIKIITGCVADSLDFAVLRSVPRQLAEDRAKALDTLRAAFWLRMGPVVGLLAAGAAFSGPLAAAVFKRADSGYLVVVTGIALIGEMLTRSAMGYFQAAQDFRRLVVLDVIVQVLRFAGVLALIAAGRLTAGTALAAYAVPPFIAWLAGLWLLPRDVRRVAGASAADIRDVYRFTRWMVIAMALAAVFERVDVMLLGFLRGPADVGVYAPALMLAMVPELVVSVVLTVLNPRVAKLHSPALFDDLVISYLKWAVPAGLAAAVSALLLAPFAIPLLFGARYAGSVRTFQVLVVGTILSAMISPVFSALLSLRAPRRTLAATIVALGIASVGGFLAIPRFGAVGMACVMATTKITTAAIIVLLARGVRTRLATEKVRVAEAV